MTSPLETSLKEKILNRLDGLPHQVASIMFEDKEIHYLQDYANNVSIKRLNFNDHGPVHMLKVVRNAITMIDVLSDSGIKLSLEREGVGSLEDSTVAVIMAAFVHDLGMTVGRENHEKLSLIFAYPIIDRILHEVYGDDFEKRVIVRSMVVEGIVGHMGIQKIHSLEAGIILIADGCDMEKGRARIPMLLSQEPKVGDIHQYSSASIEKVKITKGDELPIRINVKMSESVGLFQIEEVLFRKINSSPLKSYVELYANVAPEQEKRYL